MILNWVVKNFKLDYIFTAYFSNKHCDLDGEVREAIWEATERCELHKKSVFSSLSYEFYMLYLYVLAGFPSSKIIVLHVVYAKGAWKPLILYSII
jgi:hypothetical protein